MLLRNWSIAPRAASGFACIALMVAFLGVFSLAKMATIRDSATAMEKDWVPSIRIVDTIRENMLRVRTISLRVALDPNPANVGTYVGQYEARNAILMQNIKDYEAFVDTPEETRLYQQFQRDFLVYQKGMADSFALARQGDTAALHKLVLVDMKPVVDGTGAQLAELGELYGKGIEREAGLSAERYEQSRYIVIAVVLLAALVTVLMAWLLTRSIVRPLRDAVLTARQVAEGDLSKAIAVTGKDEVSQLQQSLVQMRERLRETLSEISGSSTQLAAASEQLNAVTEEAGRGLTRQHDEVEQRPLRSTK